MNLGSGILRYFCKLITEGVVGHPPVALAVDSDFGSESASGSELASEPGTGLGHCTGLGDSMGPGLGRRALPAGTGPSCNS